MMFRHWRGSLKWKFVICATAFHNGRIMVYYDSRNLASTANASAQTQNVIYDLADSKEIVFEVPYSASKNFTTFADDIASPSFATSSGQVGSLYAAVVNPLRAGGVVSTVKVLVYLAGGDDYELGSPNFLAMRSNTRSIGPFPAAAADPVIPGQLAGFSHEGSPGLVEAEVLGSIVEEDMIVTSALVEMEAGVIDSHTGDVAKWDQFSNLHFSERYLSVRAMIKRYAYVRDETFQYFTTTRAAGVIVGAQPMIPGIVINAFLAAERNPDWWCPFSWMMCCYSGYRGGFRHKFVITDVQAFETLHASRFSRAEVPGTYWTANYPVGQYNWVAHNSGGTINRAFVSGVVEAATPYESPETFLNQTFNTGYFTSPTTQNLLVSFNRTAAQSEDPTVQHFIAAGDDCTFLFYIGPPVLFATTFA